MIQVMIQEKQRLTGNLSTKQSLSSSLNNAVIYIDPITQEKEVTPSKQTQEVVPDIGYTGLSKVIVNSYTPLVSSKKITSNGIYKANDDNLDGYSQVCVETNGVDINDYFLTTPQTFSGIVKYITKIPELDTSKVTNMLDMFYGCKSLSSIPNLDTSKVTNMRTMFKGCSKLITIPQLDTSNVTTMYSMFESCINLTSIPFLNTSKVYDMGSMFQLCQRLVELPALDTSTVTTTSSMFSDCYKLQKIPKLDFQKNQYLLGMFRLNSELTDLGGFQNLGASYATDRIANIAYYTLNLTPCPNLTEQSLINVLTNLYDIATRGCNTQTVQLGSTNLAKLTSTAGQTALTQATNYGWTIS